MTTYLSDFRGVSKSVVSGVVAGTTTLDSLLTDVYRKAVYNIVVEDDITGEMYTTSLSMVDDSTGIIVTEFDNVGNLVVSFDTDGYLDFPSTMNLNMTLPVGFSGSYSFERQLFIKKSSYVYVAPTLNIGLLHTLDNPNAYDTADNDSFGRSVSISDTYSIVGAPNEDDAGGLDSGKSYIYNTVTGELLWTLDNPNAYDTSASDTFGSAVSISDTYCAVSASTEDDAGGLSSGKVYIFTNATGELLHTLDNPNAYGTSAGDNFGKSVAITDSYCIVGAHNEDDDSGSNSGKAYIYNTVTGALLHTLDDPNLDGFGGDLFGISVDLTDTYCVVGAQSERLEGITSGIAYIFNTVTGDLLHTLENPTVYGTVGADLFGVSVAITDSYCIVGAGGEDSATADDVGAAYIFNTVTGDLLHTLTNPTPFEWDGMGYYVDINDSFSYVNSWNRSFIFSNTTGELLDTIEDPLSSSDGFGSIVSMSDSYCITSTTYYDGDGETTPDTGIAFIFGLST